MQNYIDLVKEVLRNGVDQSSRAGEVRVLTHKSLSFDLSEGFPRLSNRFVPFKSVMVELEGFIGGITDKRWYQDRGCSFWNEWANPQTVKELNTMMLGTGDFEEDSKDCSDLGPFYPWQWRRFNVDYPGIISNKLPPVSSPMDQLSNLVETLKVNPFCRRMRVSAINPLQQHEMSLAACHDIFRVNVLDGKLDLKFNLRSSDLPLGMPANIQFYAVMCHLLARESDLRPGKLTVTIDNAHIYHNQIEGVNKMLEQSENESSSIEFSDYGSFWDWTYEDIKCVNYQHSGKIKIPVSV